MRNNFSDLIMQRAAHCSIINKNKIYVFGGYNGKEFINTIEVYNDKVGWV